jgi:DNA polymerase-3 subunit chi
MTRVDFYVVNSSGAEARLSVAARLTEKALGRGHRVFINCDARDQLDTLDDAPGSHNDVLINLALAPPSFFARFERVAEVVTQDEDSLQALRDAWRHYKDRGYPLTKHDLP